MGGFLDGDWFSISWEELRAWPNNPAFFPSWDHGPERHMIAYLELFAGYWFLRRWASRLSGWTAVVFTDNTNCLSWLTKWTGPGYVVPLLKAIMSLLTKHDVQLQVHYIDQLSGQRVVRLPVPRGRGRLPCGAAGMVRAALPSG